MLCFQVRQFYQIRAELCVNQHLLFSFAYHLCHNQYLRHKESVCHKGRLGLRHTTAITSSSPSTPLSTYTLGLLYLSLRKREALLQVTVNVLTPVSYSAASYRSIVHRTLRFKSDSPTDAKFYVSVS